MTASAIGRHRSARTPIPVARPIIGQAERTAVAAVLARGELAQGTEVSTFERDFSTLVEGRGCVAVNSGTSALHLGLLAAGIGAGDEVITPSFSFAASANAIRLAAATPVFVDIDPVTFCLDPAAVEAAVTPRTAAVMVVHLYGHPVDMGSILDIADRHQLVIVEDAAQAHGATLHDRPIGTFGLFAAFSFYATKNMTTGEGGMVVTSAPELERAVRLLRNQGMERRYHNEVIGFNARMTEISAAIGRVQLRKLHRWNEIRRSNASRLDSGLCDQADIQLPRSAPGALHVYHQYTVRSPVRDRLEEQLASRGVGTGVYYPVPIHRLPSYSLDCDLPHTEAAAREVLSLPVHPGCSPADIDAVIEAVIG